MKARNPSTGTLAPAHESYFRRKSVPGSRRRASAPGGSNGSSNNTRPNAARPPPPRQPPGGFPFNPRASPQYAHQYQQAYQHWPPPPPPPQPQARPQARPPPPRPQQQQQRAQQAPKPKPTPKSPPPPVPTLMSLVPLPRSYLNSLSIGTLKAVLYENHVRVDFSQVLEKSELVGRVAELVEDERRRLERQRREEEREEREAREAKERAERAERGEMSPGPSNGARGADGDLIDLMDDTELAEASEATERKGSGGESEGSEPKGARSPRSPPTGPQAEDRGLCVVCQDEEATLAVVDCGHLAMCARKYPPLYRFAQLADIRLLRPRHGDDEGVPHVSDKDRHAAETDQDLPRVDARSARACRGPIGVQKSRNSSEEGRGSCTHRRQSRYYTGYISQYNRCTLLAHC